MDRSVRGLASYRGQVSNSLAGAQSNTSFSFPSSSIIPRLACISEHSLLLRLSDFFTCTLLASALSHELIYRNSGTTYAASGTGA